MATTRRARTWPELETIHAFPTATVATLAVTTVLTLVQVAVPDLRLDLWRDQNGLESGQLWRLATPLLIQYDPWWNAAIVLMLIGLVGTAAERVYGSARWLVIYLLCGITGQAFGYLWAPADAGASVALAGLLGALGGWALAGSSLAPRPVRNTAWLALAGALALTAVEDMHGPPLLLGFVLASALRPR
jgi:rhomboid protease GluP